MIGISSALWNPIDLIQVPSIRHGVLWRIQVRGTACSRRSQFGVSHPLVHALSGPGAERGIAQRTQDALGLGKQDVSQADPDWTRCNRTRQRPGPDNDHTIWSFSGPEISGRDNNHTIWSFSGPEILGPHNDVRKIVRSLSGPETPGRGREHTQPEVQPEVQPSKPPSGVVAGEDSESVFDPVNPPEPRLPTASLFHAFAHKSAMELRH